MRRPELTILVLCVLIGLPAAAGTEEQSAPTAAGHWVGTIEMTPNPIPFRVELVRGAQGWSGRINVPVQGLRALALGDVQVAGRGVRFTMSALPGKPHFAGYLSADGSGINGTFQRSGKSHAFALDRSDAPFDEVEVVLADYLGPGAPGQGVVGSWRGLLKMGPAMLRVDLTIVSDEAGTLSGTVASPDQGSVVVPASGFELEDSKLSFTVKGIYGSFDGFLNHDGSELIGQWWQNKIETPITFKRQAE